MVKHGRGRRTYQHTGFDLYNYHSEKISAGFDRWRGKRVIGVGIKKRKAWFGDINIFDDEYLKKLKELAGITGIIPDNYRIHLPGYHVSEDLLDHSPFPPGWTEWPASKRDAEAGGDVEIEFPVFSGIAVQTDDTPVKKLLEKCDKIGIEVWAHTGLWGYSGNIFPELGFVDIFNKPIDERMSPWQIPLCPSEEMVREFEAASIADVVTRYNFPAINLDHGHFPPLINMQGLLGCGCKRCRNKAVSYGFNFEEMKEALEHFINYFNTLDIKKLKSIYDNASSFADCISFMGAQKGLYDWFQFRTLLVSEHIGDVTHRIFEKLGKKVPVDSHIMPPSIAYLCGQDLKKWAKSVEYVSAGWGSVVGWDAAQIYSFAALAEKIAKTVAETSEAFALDFVYRIFGYEHLALPRSIRELKAHQLNSFEVYKKEITLAAALLEDEGKVMYPFDATENLKGHFDEMAELINSCKPQGIVCFNWGKKNTDSELTAIGQCCS
jgi:hypothetical protein